MIETKDLTETLAQRLAGLQNIPKAEFSLGDEDALRNYKPAAVLLPLLRTNDEWHLLYTHRSDGLMNHSGQVSFPGGSWESGDADLTATALREAWEEVGIRPQDVRVLGQMQPMGIITHFLVTPVVGVIPWPYLLHLFDGEVTRAFTAPLKWLADPSNYYYSAHMVEGQSYQVGYYQPYEGETIWGATAKITQDFLHLLE